jgi:phosphatidylglycerol:prolipoprotein diacylglycerol transferase
MLPDTLHIGPVPIHWFGIFLALAIVAAGWAAGREFARQGLDRALAWDAVLWAALGGIVGARLWMVFETWPAFLSEPTRFLFSGSGLAWYGGFVGGTLAVTLWLRRQHIPWLVGADVLAPAIALGHAVGRMGCQVAGDGDWGTETKLPWGMAYPYAVVGWNKPPGVRVHPTPIYETLAYLAIYLVLVRLRKDPRGDGRVFGAYLTLAGTARFLVEFIRVNQRVLLGLTVAQISSLVLIVAGVVLLTRRKSAVPALLEDRAGGGVDP